MNGYEVVLAEPCSPSSDRSLLLQMVWSEDESCVRRLSESLEYMSQPKRELTEVY